MKKLVTLLFISLFAASSCTKDDSGLEKSTDLIIASLPFENTAIKVGVAGVAVPSRTNDIHFLDETTGVAATYEGEIYLTTDRGMSWELKYSPAKPNQPLNQFLFTSPTTGYVAGGSIGCNGTGCVPAGGIVLKTTDGGRTWTSIYKTERSEFVSLAANAAGNLFVAANGLEAGIFRSNDLGATWALTESTGNSLSRIVFSGQSGFYTGGGARIIRSTDNGSTWTFKTDLPYNYVNDLAVRNEVGYYVLGYSRAFRTVDNGDKWLEVTNPITSLQKINVLTPTCCLIWGGGRGSGGDFPVQPGAVAQTQDGGKTWTGIEFTGVGPVTASSFYSAQQGYAVAGRTLLKVTVK